MCQFLLGTVQPGHGYGGGLSLMLNADVSIPLRYGTTSRRFRCSIQRIQQNVSIPLRYGTTAVFSCYY